LRAGRHADRRRLRRGRRHAAADDRPAGRRGGAARPGDGRLGLLDRDERDRLLPGRAGRGGRRAGRVAPGQRRGRAALRPAHPGDGSVVPVAIRAKGGRQRMTGKPRIGVSQLVWGYDLSRPDRWLQFLDEASEIGYEGILAFDSTLPFWYNRPAELKGMLDARRLALAAVI